MKNQLTGPPKSSKFKMEIRAFRGRNPSTAQQKII
jgi:hypothetical protein